MPHALWVCAIKFSDLRMDPTRFPSSERDFIFKQQARITKFCKSARFNRLYFTFLHMTIYVRLCSCPCRFTWVPLRHEVGNCVIPSTLSIQVPIVFPCLVVKKIFDYVLVFKAAFIYIIQQKFYKCFQKFCCLPQAISFLVKKTAKIGKNNFVYGKRSRPICQHGEVVTTNFPLAYRNVINIWTFHSKFFEWIIRWEGESQLKNPFLIG